MHYGIVTMRYAAQVLTASPRWALGFPAYLTKLSILVLLASHSLMRLRVVLASSTADVIFVLNQVRR